MTSVPLRPSSSKHLACKRRGASSSPLAIHIVGLRFEHVFVREPAISERVSSPMRRVSTPMSRASFWTGAPLGV